MNIQAIKEIAEAYQAKVTGKLCVGITDLQTGEVYTLNGETKWPTASVFKVFVLAELYRQASEGIVNINDRYEMTEDVQIGGSGVLVRLKPGLNPTLYDYAMLMMILSDNTAADFLFNFVGGSEGIKKNVLEPLGLKDTKCDLSCRNLFPPCFDKWEIIETNGLERRSYRNNSGFLCVNEKDDVTTAFDIMKIFKLIYEKKLYSDWACEDMLHIYKMCQTNSRIPKFLPPGTDVAHKTGTLDCLCNDCGIVYTPKGDYILTLSYNGSVADAEEYAANDRGRNSDLLLAELSGDIYKAFIG